MNTMTSTPTQAEPFTCANPMCGVANPPTSILRDGVRVCFSCGRPKERMLHVSEKSPLTRKDRCDRCPAQAYGRVSLAIGEPLLFCGHHLTKHLPALEVLATRIEDYRPALVREEKSGLTAV